MDRTKPKITLPGALREQIEAYCEPIGMNLSTFMRQAALEKLQRHAAPQVTQIQNKDTHHDWLFAG